ncbi:family 43 glycosylhydrolase [Sphingomonas tabacisoli]|uniref:Family 43 glycosylhydrolase n=1 Tax=Sphingomonas tabacisoli TaxID=2249466 RepID=A0ABW4I0T2_9SPHN
MFRKLTALACAGALATPAAAASGQGNRFQTYANPIDLPYRFQAPYAPIKRPAVPFREAADPTVVFFKGEYWLFASHSLGYWRSKDLQRWSFVKGSGYAVDKFAPSAVAMDGKLYLAVSEGVPAIWVTDDPGSGQWRVAANLPEGYQDPDLFLDDDGRLYIYDGLAPFGPLHVAELDKSTLLPIRKADIPQSRDMEHRGWEVPGDANELVKNPSFIEGSWMTKRAGRYYLEYSGPGTEFKGYANGMLTASQPMGPFAYQPYSPFAAKPSGFITGAGHGSTFQGPGGQWWHVGTMTISARHIFERRLGLFPSRFTPNGEPVADTYLGDYPHYYAGSRGLTGWMLLSRGKAATASSSLTGFAPAKAADEDVRTWWSAESGKPGEWFQLDLGGPRTIEALQLNFADQDATTTGMSTAGYRYVVEASRDGRIWQLLIPESATGGDTPHDYQVLARPASARYVRVRNVESPNGAKFSLYDLRVFGNAEVPLPGRVVQARGTRDAADPRRAHFTWTPTKGADFYIVRFGIRPDLMIQNYQVYGSSELEVRSLNADAHYVFTIDAVNERGISMGKARWPLK